MIKSKKVEPIYGYINNVFKNQGIVKSLFFIPNYSFPRKY